MRIFIFIYVFQIGRSLKYIDAVMCLFFGRAGWGCFCFHNNFSAPYYLLLISAFFTYNNINPSLPFRQQQPRTGPWTRGSLQLCCAKQSPQFLSSAALKKSKYQRYPHLMNMQIIQRV